MGSFKKQSVQQQKKRRKEECRGKHTILKCAVVLAKSEPYMRSMCLDLIL